MTSPPSRPLSRFGMRVSAAVFAMCVAVMALTTSPVLLEKNPPLWNTLAAVNVVTLGLFIMQLSQRTLRWAVLAFYTWAIVRAATYWPAYNVMAIYVITCMLLWHVYRCVRQGLPPKRAWPWSHHHIEA